MHRMGQVQGMEEIRKLNPMRKEHWLVHLCIYRAYNGVWDMKSSHIFIEWMNERDEFKHPYLEGWKFYICEDNY